VYQAAQELERALVRWIEASGQRPVSEKQVLEVGCGTGDGLLQLLRLGFTPENLIGYELLPQRALVARKRLPEGTEIICGDAASSSFEEASFDIVMQSTVFTSLLDEGFRQRLAARMWALARGGGGILWYDFAFDNPRNPDVRGVPVRRVRELFPAGELRTWRVTLAPPLSRAATRLHPAAYSLLNVVPLLRTHRLCWIEKPI
jgi:SAM-dependent methyltransferase